MREKWEEKKVWKNLEGKSDGSSKSKNDFSHIGIGDVGTVLKVKLLRYIECRLWATVFSRMSLRKWKQKGQKTTQKNHYQQI